MRDVWTWTAIDADTKLIPCWMIGPRDPGTARDPMPDLAGRLAGRVQLTSDGLKFYWQALTGDPDPDHISTSYIECHNLTVRMQNRRFTRLTNGFSKKVENHAAQIALFMVVYNFSRKHLTVGTTPAVKAGIADHIWSIEEIIGLPEKREMAVAA